jgi:hypothetical protein
LTWNCLPSASAPPRRRRRTRRPSEAGRPAAAGLLAVLLLGAVLAPAAGAEGADVSDPAPAPPPARPDAETVRAAAREILAGPRFAERESILERIFAWFREKLRGWEMPTLTGATGWLAFLQWVILIWCVVTLVAILAHLAWTLHAMFGGRRGGRGAGFGGLEAADLAEASVEDLERLRDRLARDGRFREAVAVMLLLLLRHLDGLGLVRFHASKTNGEYVREFPPGRDDRDAFRQFVRSCDVAVYGPAPCGAGVYERLGSDFTRIRDRADEPSDV